MAEELKVAGKPLPRQEAPDMVTGRFKYCGDIYMPGMLHGRYLVSPYPHANIKSIDTSKAKALTGVRAVLTYEDVGPVVMSKVYSRNMYPIAEKARYVGDVVAAVAADTPQIAEKALELIEVDYEPLPFVTDPFAAMEPGAPEIHADGHGACEQPGNYYVNLYEQVWGDTEAGYQEADKQYEFNHKTALMSNHQNEPRAATAYWEEGRLINWITCQGVYEERTNQSKDLGIPASMIKVVCPMTGGGFGSNKFGRHGYLATLLSIAAGKRPVRVEHSRRLELGAEAHGRSAVWEHQKIGAKNDGTITALTCDEVTQQGGYTQDWAIHYSAYRGFKVGSLDGTGKHVYTNTAKGGWRRGVGMPAALWGGETAFDEVAEDLGFDPVEYRYMNMGDDYDRSSNNRPWCSCFERQCLDKVVEESDFYNRWKGWKTPVAVNGSKKRGIGVATGSCYGSHGNSTAAVRLIQDGTIRVMIGTTDVGCGQRTTQKQIAAEAVGVPYDMAYAEVGHTDLPHAPRSAGSTVLPTAGCAVKGAGEDLKQKILERAAPLLEVEPEDLNIEDARIYVKADPTKGMTLKEFCAQEFAGMSSEMPLIIGTNNHKAPPGVSYSSFVAYIIEVEVDVETGFVEVLNIWTSCDCGRPLNPLIVETQTIGGAVEGVGMALMEERLFDHQTGVCLTTDWTNYRVCTILDSPEVYPLLSYFAYDPPGAYGGKGFSESASVTIHSAVGNAIYNAIGVRLYELPMTPDKILKALGKG